VLTEASIAQILVNGLTSGSFYVLMALGFTLIFGIMRLVNFAHGEFYMLGAFVVYHLYGRLGVDFFLALAASAVTVGALGAVVERVIFVPLRSRELSMLMSALGLQIALQGIMAVTEGVEALSLPAPIRGVYRSSWLIPTTVCWWSRSPRPCWPCSTPSSRGASSARRYARWRRTRRPRSCKASR
jgi:branched-chain amino acid transport system permease protein